MNLHAEAQLNIKFYEFAKLMNIYLSHFPKSEKFGLAQFIRVAEFLRAELRLSLSKATIAPTRRGVNFVGYRTWATRRFVRRHALHNFRQAVKRSDHQAVVSSLGHARKTASHRHMIEHLQEHWHAIHRCLPPGHRRLHDLQRQAA